MEGAAATGATAGGGGKLCAGGSRWFASRGDSKPLVPSPCPCLADQPGCQPGHRHFQKVPVAAAKKRVRGGACALLACSRPPVATLTPPPPFPPLALCEPVIPRPLRAQVKELLRTHRSEEPALAGGARALLPWAGERSGAVTLPPHLSLPNRRPSAVTFSAAPARPRPVPCVGPRGRGAANGSSAQLYSSSDVGEGGGVAEGGGERRRVRGREGGREGAGDGGRVFSNPTATAAAAGAEPEPELPRRRR